MNARKCYSRSRCIDIRSGKNATYIKELVRRIDECIAYPHTSSNCIGTALFLAGEKDYDNYIGTREVHDSFLKNLERSDIPIIGAIAAWQRCTSEYIVVKHMGIVTCTAPLLITHREGIGGQFILNQDVSEAGHNFVSCDLNFYIPRRMGDKI